MDISRRKQASNDFLDLFFPIHYLVGMQIEDALKCGVLTRQQACLLWTIHTRGVDGRKMRRKDIASALASWYEVTSSAISKSLRALSKAPLNLITMTEDPENGREKFVTLTPRGVQFVESMMRNGSAFLDTMVERLSDEEIKAGVHFLARVTEIHHELAAEAAARQKPKPRRAAKPKELA
ncbi:winged helix DNA-binding protein [Hyphomonas sp.]|uniref:MarR family winged helix-turn-helix transcriptional regulator n=1 Tax=Hyphomonas sp. TaxID=87 RepID=UPI0032EF6117|tara:strand:+ start:13975 stop:14514 length:540 start_codon:yes stop_codon:yes gene_type:complete